MIAFQAELGSGDYIFVEEGDRLGFLFMDGSRAVGYNFDPSMTTNIQVIKPYSGLGSDIRLFHDR